MEWNYCLLIFMISLLSQSHANVKIILQSKSWIEAQKECENKGGGRLATADELHPINCTYKSKKVWLGKYDYERLTPWIEKTGCFFREQKYRESKPSLLECYRSCKSAPFGYKKPWCSCEDKTKSTITLISLAACTSDNYIHANALWLFNKTEIDLSNDDYSMDCISAQCKGNETIFRAVNCSSQKKAECYGQGSEFTIAGTNTQANSEKSCNKKITYLTSNPKCVANGNGERNTEEVWTGMKRYRYNITETLTDVSNCIYVECPIKSGHKTLEYTENCRLQLDGFACISNGTYYNVTTEYLSTNVPQQPTAETSIQIKSGASMQMQSNIGKSVLSTISTPELFFYHASKNVVSSSINTTFTVARANNIDMSTTSYSTVNSSFGTTLVPAISISSALSSLHFEDISTNVPPTSVVETSLWMKNSVLMDMQSNIGRSSIQQTRVMMHPQSKIGSSMLQTSEMMHTQSNIGSSIQQTSATSELINVYASQILASLTTISKLHIYSNIDMSTAVYSSVVKNKNETDLNKSNQMYNSTIRNQMNKSTSQQLSTGLIVGISVSILCLVVLIIGVFGICRLRNQRAFKEKSSLDFPIPIKPINDSNYHDIDVDPKKETNVNENDSTHPVVSAKDDDMPFRLTDNTSNGKTNKPNDAYAVVVKKPVTNKPDNTSNGKTTKYNNAHDAFAVVVKISGKNQVEDQKTSLDIPESNDSINQPRPLSSNESGNIYDNSIGHCDGSDPTYNTTTHVHARERANESDYDHF